MRLGFGTMGRGATLIGLGVQAEGIAQIRAGLANWNATGARLMEPEWFGFIAEAHLQAGQLDEASSALDRAAAPSRPPASAHIKRSCTVCWGPS
jgi:hypothetical protein